MQRPMRMEIRLFGTETRSRACFVLIAAWVFLLVGFGIIPRVAQAAAIPFLDISNHWAMKPVLLLHSLGVVRGFEDGSFRPNKEVTRAEAAEILAAAFQSDSPLMAASVSPFRDVSPRHWAFPSIVFHWEKGYFLGDSAGYFHPERPMTRAEFFAVCLRVLGWQSIPVQIQAPSFDDWTETPDWSKPILVRALQTGLMQGYSDQTIRADQPVRRSEAVAIVHRMLDEQGRLFPIRGDIVEKKELTIVIETVHEQGNERMEIVLDPAIHVFLEDRMADLSQIRVGDRAAVLLSPEGQVKALELQRSS